LQGGGLYIWGTATLTDTNVYSNTASRSGPNVFVHDNGQLTVSYLVDLTGVEGSVTVLPAPSPPSPPSPPLLPPTLPLASPPPMICLNTCGTDGDGVCQDGGWGAFGSMCDFGTDCSDCGSRLLLDPPPSPGAQDTGPGLAIGLALGGCLLVAVLAAAVFVWHRKRRMQPPTGSSTRAPQQVEVTVAQPDSQKV